MKKNEQRATRDINKLKRPLYTTLIAMLICLNLFVAIDVVLTNRTTKKVNEEISELNEMQAETIRENQELNEHLKEMLNRRQ